MSKAFFRNLRNTNKLVIRLKIYSDPTYELCYMAWRALVGPHHFPRPIKMCHLENCTFSKCHEDKTCDFILLMARSLDLVNTGSKGFNKLLETPVCVYE